LEGAGAWERIESLAFFAMPPERRREGLIPIYAAMENGAARLQGASPHGQQNQPRSLFFALPPTIAPTSAQTDTVKEFHSSAVVPLYEYRRAHDDQRLYSTQETMPGAGLERSPEPFCRVWRNPMALVILDAAAKPFATQPK